MIPINLYPFPAWLTPQIPATTANAISYEEMIRQFIYKLNEVIKRCNSVQEFSEEVKKELDEFNKHVVEVTTSVLTEMYENGQLEEILQNVSTDYFDNLRNQLLNILNDSQLSYDEENEKIYISLLDFYNNESEE